MALILKQYYDLLNDVFVFYSLRHGEPNKLKRTEIFFNFCFLSLQKDNSVWLKDGILRLIDGNGTFRLNKRCNDFFSLTYIFK